VIATKSGAPGKVAALAVRGKAGPTLWLANLTGETQTAKVSGFAGGALLNVLDEGSFVAATKDAGWLNKGGKLLKKVGSVALAPYAIARIAAV
jgi:hypothetical protein